MTYPSDSKESRKFNDDEIDLRLVYNKIKELSGGAARFFNRIIETILKRIFLIGAISLICGGIGTGLYYMARPVYISSMTLSSNVLTNDVCAEMIENLQLMVEDDAPELLAEVLELDTSITKKIKKIEFENFNEELTTRYKIDTIVVGVPFKIKVHTYSKEIFKTIQPALVNHLENNDYAMKRKKIKLENLTLLREKLKKEISEIDSLKSTVADHLIPRGNPSGFVFGQPIDPIPVFKEGVSLFTSDLQLNSDIFLLKNIEVVSDFNPRQKPQSPKLLKNIFWGCAAGFFLGFLLAWRLEKKRLQS